MSDLRGKPRDDLEDFYDDALRVIKEAVKQEKWYGCSEAGCRGRIHFPDVNAIVKALDWLWDRGVGRPAAEVKAPTLETEDLTVLSDEELRGIAAGAGA
jgi:hypothetical protein